ncbi:MAG: RluA family pseudouridine synthase [Micavibrio sp.]|nr:RluA family pseudouridine synthase [Micavibrio sp.]
MAEGVIVSENDNGQRLDRWLKKHYPDVPFGAVQKILRTGQLRVDGKRVKGDARLAAGQSIRIPPQMLQPQPKLDRGLSDKDIDFVKSLVIYRDEDVIAVNKPAGLASQGGTKVGKNLDYLLDGLKFGNEHRPHLVHRLDMETSGVMILARHTQCARILSEMFRGRDIRKYYWAITTPAPELEQGKIRSAIGKVDVGGGERIMATDGEDGKMSLTFYNVMERLGKAIAWVAFWPRTGRQHQIRVHALEMGTPLLGDFKYAREQEFLQENPTLPQSLHLHARRLILPHPMTGRKLDITAPLEGDMKKTFKYFGFDADDKTDPFADLD